MLNLQQVKQLIRNVLNAIGFPGGETAVNLVFGTAIQESSLIYLEQVPSGIAVSLFQIEEATYLDLINRMSPSMRHKILAYCSLTDFPKDYKFLIGNLTLSIIMARMKYYLIPEALPANDPEALAEYHKKYYNTVKGRTDINRSTINFNMAVKTN
jgi:hypothetical protein